MLFGSRSRTSGSRMNRHHGFERLLPHGDHSSTGTSPIPPVEVTKIALRLKYLVEEVIPFQMEEDKIVKPNSRVLTPDVIRTAKEAGGEEYKACIVYCLLVVKRWFYRQAQVELWDAELHQSREVACQMIAKLIIEAEQDEDYLMELVLLQRYSMHDASTGEDTPAVNAIELAVDNHALCVIGSSGYQKCISFLWRGWYVPDPDDVSHFIEYKDKAETRFRTHFHPDRLRVPVYQNIIQMGFSFLYLALYTLAINSINQNAQIDFVEIMLYVFTCGFVCDELSKFWKVGKYYISFWNVFNLILYTLLSLSFGFRMIALKYPESSPGRESYNELSYNFLAATAPMFWGRLLLFLDSFRFFGAMMVVLKVMMKESIIFFALLTVIVVGFFQAFIGLDQVDDNVSSGKFVVQAMVNVVMGSPDFDGFDNYAPPFGLILYYIYSFVVMVVLLNILIALYNSAYEDITGNAVDEYMALFAQKTMRFVRAPDENVFIPPLNLIEMIFLILPFEWWMDRKTYANINDAVMLVLYSPFLFVTAILETSTAREVAKNRRSSEADDHQTQDWDVMLQDFDPETDGWGEKVARAKPNVAVKQEVVEILKLRKQISDLQNQLNRQTQDRKQEDPPVTES